MTCSEAKIKVNKLIQGKSFDDLVEVMEVLQKDRDFSFEIKYAIIDRMAELNRERFEEWAEVFRSSLAFTN